jgi:acetate---CoA ligase (ADP-forming)
MSPGGRDLNRLFHPESVAVVGASADPSRVGARVLASLRRHHYPGRVFAVDRRAAPVEGLEVVPAIEVLPFAPDVAVLAVSARNCPQALEALGSLGTRNVVVLASGFEEASDGGAALARKLGRSVRRHGMNLVGPNSQGLWSLSESLVMAFGSETGRSELVPGPVAVLSSSGSLGGAVAAQLQDQAVGISHMVSLGNETDLCLADYLEYLLDCDEVRVVACYVEGIREGPRLIQALRRANERGVDVVILPAGLGGQARRTTRSHTGRMLSSGQVLLAVCRQHGALAVASMRELVEACRVLALSSTRLRPRPRIGMLGISGGMLALMSDSCEREGLKLPRLRQETEGRLRTILPPFATAVNPVDVTGAVLEQQGLLSEVIETVRADQGVDILVVGLDNRGYARVRELGAPSVAQRAASDKPLLEVLWQPTLSRDRSMEWALAAAGVLVVDEPADVGTTLGWLARRSTAEPDLGAYTGPTFPSGAQLEDWTNQRRLLEGLGLTVPAGVTVQEPSDFTQPDLDLLGCPVVVKPVPNLVQHKSDHGLVFMDLWTLSAVTNALRMLRERLPQTIPLLVQAQVSGVEVLIAARCDQDWGPVLTIGSGGVMTELMDDSFSVSIPCAASQIGEGLASLKLGQRLAGYRGRAPSDRRALVRFACRLQAFFLAHERLLKEVELNPVIVGAQGNALYAVDFLAQ